MELWWLGFSISGIRLFIFVLLGVVLVAGLSYYEGISDTFGGRDDILDTTAAYFVGFTSAALMLYLFGVVRPGMHVDEVVGKIALQAIPASIGAIFGEAVLGVGSGPKISNRATGYTGQIFLTVAGAVFLGMSVSPTEEMRLIAFQMGHWFSLFLALFTLLLTHIFIYASNRGQEELTDASFFDPALFLRFSVVAYAVVLIVSGYILWTFGSLDGMGALYVVKTMIVLAFPAALGASASKLLI